MSTDELRAAIGNGTLGKSTAAELKAWLQSKGLSTSGKKQDLLDRIEQWVEEA
jgi:ATP-dependent DNA helicase 2 subunit 1